MRKILLATILTMVLGTVANAQKYKVGDIYDKDGLKGIVVKVDDSGEHGLIMSLKRCVKKWLSESDDKFETGAFHEDDGEKNMEAIEKYINENGKSWEQFPYFEWCRSLGEGWYAPATDELKDILQAINGGTGPYNSKTMKVMAKMIKKAKGDGLINTGYMGSNNPYWMYSSTETDGGMISVLMFKEKTSSAITRAMLGKMSGAPKGDFVVTPYTKSHTGGKMANVFGSRAVHKF